MATVRATTARLLTTCAIVLTSTGIAVATADELPASSPEVYRSTSGSSNLESNGWDGSGVTVAVIDSGVANVPGFDGKLIHQQNISAAPASGDQYGHGTFVAGIVHRVAPGAQIISIKLSDANGAVDVTQVLAALQWVRANKDRYSIDAVNLSFGNDSKQSAYASPLNYAVQKVWDSGIVVVASAGNLGNGSNTVTKPGDDPVIISVGASDEHGTSSRGDDTIPTFVSRGPTQDGLAKPDLVAPGTRVISLRAPGSTVDMQNPQARVGTDEFRGSGTSFAAPIVTGIVAQLLQADPSLSPDQVKYGLLQGATEIDGDATAMGAGTVRGMRALIAARSGRANQGVGRSHGHGSLHASRGSAVVDVKAVVDLGPLSGIATVAVPVVGEHTAEAVDEAVDAPLLGGGDVLLDAIDEFDATEFTDESSWDASQWGASQWGASQWGASHWGASQWGASQWGSSQWWASQWG
ncbi:MAG: aprX [Thermoleophilia bacterium]|nr:aprX [Thermoleophilia bacterium]